MAQTTSYQCPDCPRSFTTGKGRQRHRNSAHQQFTPASEGEDNHAHTKNYHPKLTGRPCNRRGQYLPPFTPPPPSAHLDAQPPGSWHPFHDRTEFDFAHFHFVEVQSSAAQINTALDQWTAQVLQFGHTVPWSSTEDLYKTIDDIQHGDTPWKVYKLHYTGPRPNGLPPKWMTEEYELCARDCRTLLHHQLATPEFCDKIEYGPYRQFDSRGHRVWSNLMSRDWAWKQADLIAEDESTHGAMFVPIVAGSDKTTVSVATGHQEYTILTPFSIEKAQEKTGIPTFSMTTPEVVHCADGHFHRVIYGLGPYIADYPEQVWLSCIVQNWCVMQDPINLMRQELVGGRIQKLRSLVTCFDPGTLWDDFGIRSDVIVIKGTFKDHLVEWVNQYFHMTYGEARALEIIADIDHRASISPVPSFPGLRRFPDGHDFSQWTGDDSKALMKVYLAAIAGYVPPEMVKTVAAFMDFCYLVRRNAINSDTLVEIKAALDRFHVHRDIFVQTGIRVDISLPCQHSLLHYLPSIQLFGSPNGLCSRYKALIQMLHIICRLDKMAAICSIFAIQGMMAGSTSSYAAMVLRGESPQPPGADEDSDDDDEGDVPGPRSLSSVELACTPARAYPPRLVDLAVYIQQPQFPELVRCFLYEQLHSDSDVDTRDIPIDDCPRFDSHIKAYHSATARFYAPSDLCGAGGMRCERIRSNPQWHGAYPRCDTVFINVDAELPGMLGIIIGRIFLFFSFTYHDIHYPCALVQWFPRHAATWDDVTGLWVVTPEAYCNGQKCLAVIHLDSIARTAHLIPVYRASSLPENFHYSYSLDAFRAFFVNSYADHHVHEFLYS
ncbi:hypothetical protein K438DRAFT_1963910 [Mycena galopus ATCC 62051]|nr:hypothetical protein K438DRAFT_1963910 [Mycena galopus ATCC 62051]